MRGFAVGRFRAQKFAVFCFRGSTVGFHNIFDVEAMLLYECLPYPCRLL